MIGVSNSCKVHRSAGQSGTAGIQVVPELTNTERPQMGQHMQVRLQRRPGGPCTSTRRLPALRPAETAERWLLLKASSSTDARAGGGAIPRLEPAPLTVLSCTSMASGACSCQGPSQCSCSCARPYSSKVCFEACEVATAAVYDVCMCSLTGKQKNDLAAHLPIQIAALLLA